MENMDVLVRGILMQNPGLGSLGLIDLGGLEWAWTVAVVATIVVAFVSVKRVSLVSVGLSWREKPGGVRVRVQSFSSSSDGNCIVTASGVFSAELLKSSEAEVKDSLEGTKDASKVAAEMVFIFEKKTTAVVLPKLSSVLRAEKIKTRRKVRASSATSPPVAQSGLPSIEGKASVSRREGIEWDAGIPPTTSTSGRRMPSFLSRRNSTTFDMAGHIRSLTTPLASTDLLRKVPPSMFKTSPSTEWDPMLKMRMCDAVLGGSKNFEVKRLLPLAPIKRGSENLITLKNAVVRLWDRNDRSVLNSVNLPTAYGSASAFDVDWGNQVAAVARVDGSLSVAHLDCAMYEKTFHTQQSMIQSLRFRDTSNTLISGECGTANAECSVSLWDIRTSNRQLHTKLDSAAIYGLTLQGHELYVQDELSSSSEMDLRMLRSNVSTVSSNLKEAEVAPEEVAPEDRWWESDVGLVMSEEGGDDDYWDSGSMDEVKGGGGTLMGSFVLAVSRSFSPISLGR